LLAEAAKERFRNNTSLVRFMILTDGKTFLQELTRRSSAITAEPR